MRPTDRPFVAGLGLVVLVCAVAMLVALALAWSGGEPLTAQLPDGTAGADPSGSPSVAPASAPPATGASGSPSSSALPSPSNVPPSPPPSQPAASGTLRPGSVNATTMDVSAEYTANVTVGFASRAFRVAESIAVRNTSARPIDRLELNTIVARLGRLVITAASVNGVRVRPTIADQTIRLPLGGILDPGGTATVRLSYRATLQSTTGGSSWLFTRMNGIVEAHRWLPWISRPTPFDRPNTGDPFVTGTSPRVRVTVVSDRALRWATTGDQVSGSGRTATFEARNVRDFAMVGAPDFAVRTAKVGRVVIRVFSRPGFPATTVLAAARSALAKEAALLGAYPYPTYDVAQSAGGSGMEAPGLTWIPTRATNLRYLLAHETAHQWFYGIVGNDQARQPFADEAATDFVARYVTGLRRSSRCATARLDLPIYRYTGACYYEAIYIQGGNLLDDARRAMGSKAFWAAIREYLAENRYGIASTQALLGTLDRHTSLDLARTRFARRFPSLY